MSRSSSHRALVPSACLAVLLLLGACASVDTTGGAGDEVTEAATAEPAPTAAPTSAPAEDPAPTEGSATPVPDDQTAQPSTVTGTLGLEDIEGGCTTLTVDGERYELIAAPDADIVIDSGNGVVATTDGEQIARAGDTITVEGAVDAGMMTFCQIGPVFVAVSVTAG